MSDPAATQIGGYRVTCVLTPDQSWLAIAPGGRKVVLKLLDPDCLQRGKLHPNIHSRLSRVRELAHSGVANLLGVERLARGTASPDVFAIWEYIQGETLDRHAATLASPAELTRLAREIILTVQSLHALGIVHGRLHAGNLIIDPLKQVKLTHVSPLLYDDPDADVHDLTTTLATVATQRGWPDCDLARAIALTATLTQLRTKLSAGPEDYVAKPTEIDQAAKTLRRKAIIAALLTAVLGIAIAAIVMKVSTSSTHDKPIPPEAPPQAMRK